MTRRGLGFDPRRPLGALLFLGLWQAASASMAPILLPSPWSVVRRASADFWSAPSLAYYGVEDPSLFANLVYTSENVAIAVLFGASLGALVGLAASRIWLVRAIVNPIMLTAGTAPILIAAPFLLIWFGVGRASAVSLVAFYVATILYLFAERAARNLDPIYEHYALTLGADRRRIIRDILVPATVPELLGGFRIALAGAWGLEAVSELLGAQAGIGKVLEVLAGATDAQGILASLVLLGLVALAADACAAALIARFATWSSAGGQKL